MDCCSVALLIVISSNVFNGRATSLEQSSQHLRNRVRNILGKGFVTSLVQVFATSYEQASQHLNN
jgi:hypothetical protein